MYKIKNNIDRLKDGKPTYFLDKEEVKIIERNFKNKEYNIYKCYIDSEKLILYKDIKPKVILFKINTKEKLKHQDILGSIFSLNIDKGLFGDIIIDEDNYYFYILESMKEYFLTYFTKIKNYNISLEEININKLKNFTRKYLELEFTVKSLRLDTIIAKIANTSRSRVKEKFKNKEIILNYSIATNYFSFLKENDIFSIKRNGKYKYIEKVKQTKKNNYIIKIHKYL